MNYISAEVIANEDIIIENHLPDLGIGSVKEEILKGLRSSSKYISPKFFYDTLGSELFEQITNLEEYYPARTEKKMLETIIRDLDISFSDKSIVELGSGDASKISLILNQVPINELYGLKYYPIDISQSAIEGAADILALKFPSIEINGVVADFINQLSIIPKAKNRLFCFFGSTIGNLNRADIKKFMSLLGNEMQIGDSLLLGMDMVKDISILEDAYNDNKRITAEFNLNILNVINSLIGADFDINSFEHLAFYNLEKNRIEMHLKAKCDMLISLKGSNETIEIKKGETIHTENSHKFSIEDITTVGQWAGLKTNKIIMDNNKWFSLIYYQKTF